MALALAVLGGLAVLNWASYEGLIERAGFRARALHLAGSVVAHIEHAWRLSDILNVAGAPARAAASRELFDVAADLEIVSAELAALSRAGARHLPQPEIAAMEEDVLAFTAELRRRAAGGPSPPGKLIGARLLGEVALVRDGVERANEDAIRRLRRYSLLRLGIALGLLLGLGAMLLRPFFRSLREEVERLGGLLSHTMHGLADGVILLGAGGEVLDLNPAARRLFGEVDGRAEGWLERVDARKADGTSLEPGDLPGLRAMREKADVEVEWRFRSGGVERWTWVSTHASPLRGPKGEVTGAVSISRDVTRQKDLEEQLLRKSEELARSNADLQTFASVASHELQEPMRKVIAFTERLRSRVGAGLAGEASDDLERVERAGRRMVRLTDSLLRYARVDARPHAFEALSLEEVFEDALFDVEERLKDSGGRIDHEPLPEVRGDASQLRQVFANLLSNALKFRRPGEPPRVVVSCRDLGEAWEIRVADNGIGFEPSQVERIFEPFARLHARELYEGTGMGLAISRRIAQRHGGDLRAEGRPGEGAVLILRLPKDPAGPNGDAPPDGVDGETR